MAVTAAPPAVRWITKPRNLEQEAIFRRELGLSPLVAILLAQRGFTDSAEAARFLNPSLDDLHDPRLLPDYEAAKDALLGARERKEKIYVHGDYDVDGVTSAAIFTRFLRRLGCDVTVHVPHRMKEGYGIHESAILAAKEEGASLFLTCDCGASAHDQIAMANELGMRVVVTDHHEVGANLPNALAVVNPHRHDSQYPFAELCGAGVVFKLCQGLCQELELNVAHFHRAFLDLAVLGTVADVMPLTGENRIITAFGLQHLRDTKKPGLRALLKLIAEGKPLERLNASHIGFQLGPRLNAAGRIDDAARSLTLLMEEDPKGAEAMAQELDRINKERRQEQEVMLQEAIEQTMASGQDTRNVIVVSSENWHPGINGIVAGKLVEKFHRPAFVASINVETGEVKGSARTIPGFNLANAIEQHRTLLLSGGGHAAAAGFAVKHEHLEGFAGSLHDYAGTFLTPDDFVPTLTIDAEVTAGDADLRTAKELVKLEPFGVANCTPRFMVRCLEVQRIQATRNPEHFRLVLGSPQGEVRSAMAFFMQEAIEALSPGDRVDMIIEINVDDYNGLEGVKWIARHVRPAEA